MKRFAAINNDRVVDIFFAEDNYVDLNGGEIIVADDNIQIGWVLISNQWVDIRSPWLIEENKEAPYPDDGLQYSWDEATLSWVLQEGV